MGVERDPVAYLQIDVIRPRLCALDLVCSTDSLPQTGFGGAFQQGPDISRLYTGDSAGYSREQGDGVRGAAEQGKGRLYVPTARQAKRAGPDLEAGPEVSAE